MEKKYYKISELKKMGYPAGKVLELCRSGKIGKKSDPFAKRGYHYMVTIKEVEDHWDDWR